MRYFSPPQGQNWRMVRVVPEPDRLRVDWFPPADSATSWNVAMRSVTTQRYVAGVAGWRDALMIGLLQPVTDASISVELESEFHGDRFFVWQQRGDHACSDETSIVRLRVEGTWLLGIVCRVRPPCGEQDRNELVGYVLNQVQLTEEDPQPDVTDPARDARVQRELPVLNAALAQADHATIVRIVEALDPVLMQGPLSRLAVDVNLLEGAAKRRAFEGDAGAPAQAIESLRRALDNVDADVYPETRRRGLRWLAEAYAKRDVAGDLERSIRSYLDAVLLADAPDSDLAWDYLRIGVLERGLGAREPTASEKAGEHARRALAFFDKAGDVFETCDDPAGRVEVNIAKADTLRMGIETDGQQTAADLYGQAWTHLTVGGSATRFEKTRYDALIKQVFLSMQELDISQFGHRGERSQSEVRAIGTLLRPLTSTRALALHPPPAWRPPAHTSHPSAETVTLELALSLALSPDVLLTYVGGHLHPTAADTIATTSESGDWQEVVKILLEGSDMVLLVPGYTPGMQWELRYLTEQGYLRHSLLIMLPQATDRSAKKRWEGARSAAKAFGLDLPPYDTAGAFLRFDNDRSLKTRLGFEAIWQPAAVVEACADLMRTPEEIGHQHDQLLGELDLFEREGLVHRVRMEISADRDDANPETSGGDYPR